MVSEVMIKLKQLLKEDAEEFAQISNLPLPAFVSRFKDIANDSKVQSVIHAGLTDGRPQDEKMSFTSKKLKAEVLIPTQKEIGQNESLVSILNDKYNSLDSILEGQTQFNKPIVTLNCKFIIDGHHRWSQAFIANPETLVPVYDMTATITPQQALKAVHIAIAADQKELPLSAAKGINLFSATEKVIQTAVNQYLTEQARKLYEEHGHGSTSEEITAYLWKNVQLMQKNNKPISGAPPRTSMPQTDDAPNFDDLLTKGIVNFKNPNPKDVKTESSIKLKDLIKRNK
jgi:hypothetical protein